MAVIVPEAEKDRARHHMGYLGVESAQTFALGIPAAMQTTFMIEGALDRIMPAAYARFKMLLQRLDDIECEVFSGIDLASVNKLDSIDVNRKRLPELARYYRWAQSDLGNLLGVPANPWDMREIIQMSSGGVNVPVTG